MQFHQLENKLQITNLDSLIHLIANSKNRTKTYKAICLKDKIFKAIISIQLVAEDNLQLNKIVQVILLLMVRTRMKR